LCWLQNGIFTKIYNVFRVLSLVLFFPKKVMTDCAMIGSLTHFGSTPLSSKKNPSSNRTRTRLQKLDLIGPLFKKYIFQHSDYTFNSIQTTEYVWLFSVDAHRETSPPTFQFLLYANNDSRCCCPYKSNLQTRNQWREIFLVVEIEFRCTVR
jgi:hypothetical protein